MTRYPHTQWADAFNIDPSEGAFIGWNGQCFLNEVDPSFLGYQWLVWRKKFWEGIAFQAMSTVGAINYAHNSLSPTAPEPNPKSVWSQYNKPKLVYLGSFQW